MAVILAFRLLYLYIRACVWQSNGPPVLESRSIFYFLWRLSEGTNICGVPFDVADAGYRTSGECFAMSMKGLNQFRRFNFPGFVDGKDLTVTSLKPWKEYESGKVLGTAVTVAITRDETPYKSGKDGTRVSNLFEKFTIKVPAASVSVKIGDMVTAINPVATVYGQYSNELSVKADDVVKVTAQTAQAATGDKK